jgi:hypothetical protein
MITKTGKDILTKYLIGQTQSYASYIALGCGPLPKNKNDFIIKSYGLTDNVVTIVTKTTHNFLIGDIVTITGVSSIIDSTYTITAIPSNDSFSFLRVYESNIYDGVNPDSFLAIASVNIDNSNKKSLDFEMFRVPIISRSSKTNDAGATTISMLAELPSQNIYNISEIGLYPSSSNPSAGSQNSKMLFSFNQTENWEYHSGSSTSSTILLPIASPLDTDSNNIIKDSFTVGGITGVSDIFATTINNKIFSSNDRKSRYEDCRNANSSILIRGDSANHIHINGIDLSSLSGTSESTNELRLAFSVINKEGAANGNKDLVIDQPGQVDVTLEFATSEGNLPNTQYENIKLNASLILNGTNTFNKNRYFVVSKKISNLTKSSNNFSWKNVKLAKVSASIYGTTVIDSNTLTIGAVSTVGTLSMATIPVSSTAGLSVGQNVYSFNDNGRLGIKDIKIESFDAGSITISSYGQIVAGDIKGLYSVNKTKSNKFYVMLDGLRFENVLLDDPKTGNPLYGLTAYSPINFNNESLLFKNTNSKNYVEFNFNVGLTNTIEGNIV